MKLQNIQEVEEFRKVVHQGKGRVYLESLEGDIFNLKSAMSEYVALGRLLSEQGDSLELFADSKEDEALLLNFLGRLDESLLGEHAFHGVVCVRENRIVKGNGVWKRRCGWRGVYAECVVESVMGGVY